MIGVLINNFFRFCILVLIQVLILKKITLMWWAQPYGFPAFVPDIYPLFLLLLPFEIPVWGLLLLGFVTGLTIDTFMNTAGIHAAACVFIAYLRTNVLTALMPRNLQEYANLQPTIKTMGWMPFLVYSAFLLLLHQIIVHSIMSWSFANFGRLVLQVVASTLTSMLFVVLYILLFTKQATTRL